MANITYQEIQKLAEISRIHVSDEETHQLVKEIEAVLDYAEYLQAVAAESELPPLQSGSVQANVWRNDEAHQDEEERERILNQAPRLRDAYFVVPQIVKQD